MAAREHDEAESAVRVTRSPSRVFVPSSAACGAHQLSMPVTEESRATIMSTSGRIQGLTCAAQGGSVAAARAAMQWCLTRCHCFGKMAQPLYLRIQRVAEKRDIQVTAEHREPLRLPGTWSDATT